MGFQGTGSDHSSSVPAFGLTPKELAAERLKSAVALVEAIAKHIKRNEQDESWSYWAESGLSRDVAERALQSLLKAGWVATLSYERYDYTESAFLFSIKRPVEAEPIIPVFPLLPREVTLNLKRLCEELNGEIKKHILSRIGSNAWTFVVPEGYSRKVAGMSATSLENAGYTATVRSDQREGETYIEFSVRESV